MAILYCALMLLIEGLDQKKNINHSSKLDCYDYFYMLNINKNEIPYDKKYIELTTRIIA